MRIAWRAGLSRPAGHRDRLADRRGAGRRTRARDRAPRLKPANIKVTPDGSIRVLDFGVAKALDLVSGSSDTVTSHEVTQDGVVIGTASYMSPEQARGLPVDRRTDIWAFGCVLYEMLTGRRAFRGETTSDINAAILTAQPDWSALPAATPAGVRRVLTRLLQKDLKQRLRDIADVRFALEEAGFDPSIEAPALTGRTPRVWQMLAVVSTVLAIALGAMLLVARRPSSDVAPAVGSRALVTLLTGSGGFAASRALAPDGGSFVYVSDDRGQPTSSAGRSRAASRSLSRRTLRLKRTWCLRRMARRSTSRAWMPEHWQSGGWARSAATHGRSSTTRVRRRCPATAGSSPGSRRRLQAIRWSWRRPMAQIRACWFAI